MNEGEGQALGASGGGGVEGGEGGGLGVTDLSIDLNKTAALQNALKIGAGVLLP